MTTRRRILVWAVVVLYTVSLGTLLWSDISSGRMEVGESVALGGAFTMFLAVGLAIVVRRSGHVIGWLFVGVAVYAMTQAALASVGERLLESGGTEVVYALSNVAFSWPTLLAVMVVIVPLLFPTGRLPSPGWRWLAWLTGASIVVVTVLNLVQRDVCVTYDEGGNCLARVDNPFGISSVGNLEESTIGAVLFGVLAVCIIGAGSSLVFRYRRAVGVEKAQLKWITLSVSLLLAYVLVFDIFISDVLGLEEALNRVVADWLDPFGIFLAFIPISVGLAILRYRLYDIDRIISRTVAYGLITVVLVSAYVGIVFLLGRLMPDQSDLTVAGSTLAVAALFNPLRRRVQAAVDRRFNRSRYDSEQVVEGFGRRLRAESDLGELSRDLVEVTASTMQPEWASLWLRERTL